MFREKSGNFEKVCLWQPWMFVAIMNWFSCFIFDDVEFFSEMFFRIFFLFLEEVRVDDDNV